MRSLFCLLSHILPTVRHDIRKRHNGGILSHTFGERARGNAAKASQQDDEGWRMAAVSRVAQVENPHGSLAGLFLQHTGRSECKAIGGWLDGSGEKPRKRWVEIATRDGTSKWTRLDTS